MQLRTVTVKKFRNIVDSSVITIDESMTCLVGLNEAGKTSLLRAIHLIKPHNSASLDVSIDYPRWLWKRDERAGTIGEVPAVAATFELDESDSAAIFDSAGVELAGTVATVERKFEQARVIVGISVNEKKTLATAASAVADLSEATTEAANRSASLAAFQSQTRKIEAGSSERQEFEAVLQAYEQHHAAARKALYARLPTFFYFDNYALLPGRIELSDLNGSEEIASTGVQTARALLNLANTTTDQLASDEYESRKAELEAVSADLTDQIFEYWQQNTNLRVVFDVDTKTTNSYNGTHNERWLEIRVEDTEHRFTSNFERRSHGFQWFFSFLAAFTEFEIGHKDTSFVVLLDEPGVSLHGLAQRDLLRFINERLGSAVQVVYTTHSPFMVETNHIERVRIVEDQGKNVGATVTQDVLKVNDESLFPLQSALGYDAGQHLFVGRNNVAVEGASDVVYLAVLSRRLTAEGKTSLDSRWSLIPTGGASNLPAFAALLGSKVEVTVIMDSGTEGAGKVQAALDAGRITSRRLIRIGEILGREHADIEDLFTVADYLTIFNSAFKTTYTEADLGHGDRIIKRLEQPHGKFDHFVPADALLRNPNLVDGLSQQTLENFAALAIKVNGSRRK